MNTNVYPEGETDAMMELVEAATRAAQVAERLREAHHRTKPAPHTSLSAWSVTVLSHAERVKELVLAMARDQGYEV